MTRRCQPLQGVFQAPPLRPLAQLSRGRASCAAFMLLALLCAAGACRVGWSQTVDVSAEAVLEHAGTKGTPGGSAGIVVWLTPLTSNVLAAEPPALQHFVLAQREKQFQPHLLVVPVGSSVDFPNLDPFFHNVFSLFNGKRFDLGLYEGHSHRAVRFDREGVSYIFCNIHPDMGAVIVSLSTPFYAVSNDDGRILLRHVVPGRYRVHVWAENVDLQTLHGLSRDVQIDAQNKELGMFRLQVADSQNVHHKNKFGEDYVPVPTTTYP